MIYKKHNLMKNFYNANGVGDEAMQSDILTSEVAKFIVGQPRNLVGLLNKHSKSKIVGIPSTKKLTTLTADALYKNKEFAEAVAMDIFAINNTPIFSEDGKTDYAGLLKGTSDLVKGLGDLFGGIKGAKAKTEKAKAEADKAKSEAEKALYEKVKGLQRGKTPNTGLYIGIGLGAAAVIGVIVYFVKRK